MDSRPFNPDLLQSLSPVGRALFSKFGRGPAIEVPFKCVHEAFEFHARTEPDECAVEDGQVKVTYAELDRQANCLAAHLREKEVMGGTRVGLLVERSVFMVVGLLAILKAGGAYIPLDGNTISKSGLAHALRDSDASLVLLQRKFADKVFMIPTVCIEDIVCSTPSDHCVKPEDTTSPGDSACIIYSNGTTDDADGVDVLHRNIVNLVCLAPGNLAMSPGMRVAQTMSISSDMAAWEMLGSLCNGSTLCLRGKTAKEWRAVMRTVDIMITTPSLLAPHDPSDYPNMKVVAVAGEHCPKRLADTWAETVDFYNCCGPIEITIVNTMHLHSPGEGLGIGVPIPNTTVYLLDEHLMPVKIGDTGVIWAGGAGITRGYVNNGLKSAERYLRDPFLNDGSMMFNTGDLARWHPDGNLEHLGRLDHQVKIKGFKIELDRVAGAIETTPGVKSAAAIMIEGDIWGFYTPINIAVEVVQKSTAQVLPHYGMPSKFMALEKFPETTNGKIDKKALQDLAIHTPEFEPYTPIPDAAVTPEIPVPQVPIFPLLVGQEKAEKPLLLAPSISPTEWNVSAGSTKRLPVKRKSPPPPPSPVMDLPYRTPTPPRPSPFSTPSASPSSTPPPIPARSLRREHSRKRLDRPDPESNYSEMSQDLQIPSPRSFHHDLPRVAEERLPVHEWDNVSRVSPTPTWVNNETMSIETHVGTLSDAPMKKEMTDSEMEDQTSIWSGLDQGTLPEKEDVRIFRLLRHKIFTTWARLFSFVFFINFCVFIAAAAEKWSAYQISKGVFGNLFLAAIIRQDYLIDGVFLLATRTPASWPLWARKIAVDVHQLGGVHAGAAASSGLWFLLYTGKATRESVMQSEHGQKAAAGTVAIAWFTLLLLLGTLTFAYPKIQDRFRHSFETIHRYCAWGIVILLWIEVPLLANDYRKPGVPLHVAIRECSAFWLLLLTSVSMLLPWIRLRKVAVYSKRLSPQAVRMYFDYATPQPGSIVKVSDDILTEWHNFPAVCEPGNPGFSVVLAKGGYWTSTQVANPPSKLWVRGVPFYGIMRLVPVFQKIVLVATGCGIANCMPVVLERRIPIRLLWIAPNVRQVYGDKLVDSILDANPAALILNSRQGDPDLVKMTYRLAKETEAEAVIVVSNKRVTEKVVYGLTSRGIPAYGSICIEEP